jgi:hypothetical protein
MLPCKTHRTKLLMQIIYFLLLVIVVSCSNKQSGDNHKDSSTNLYDNSPDTESEEEEAEYSDGTWCAEVEYYNPSTGTRNTYTLDVEVEGGELVQIDWPNGGWLDESHFVAEDISSGECSFTSDRGYEYTVTLEEEGGCGSTDGYRMQNDMEEERKVITCPKCGDEKDTYEDMCDDCEDEAETCPKCNGYKMEWDRICNSCEAKREEEEQEGMLDK